MSRRLCCIWWGGYPHPLQHTSEDNALGKLPDARYAALDAQYAKEQGELAAEIAELEKAIGSYEQSRKSAGKFIALISKYENFDTMLNEFVEKILVHERDRKGSQDTTQEVEIYFNFVGRYVPPHFGEVALTAEEQEELRRKEEHKDRLHQNYLHRMTKGVFIPVSSLPRLEPQIAAAPPHAANL